MYIMKIEKVALSSLSSSSKTKISFPASSLLESVKLIDKKMDLFHLLSLLFPFICDFSFSLLAVHGCNSLKQLTGSSELILSSHDLNDCLITSVGKDAHDSKIHCTFRFQIGALRMPSTF